MSFSTIRKVLKIYLASFIASFFVRLLGLTLRITYVGREHIERLLADNRQFIGVFWHGDLFLMVYTHRNMGAVGVTSQSDDGEILTRVTKTLGFDAVRGSSTRGGMRLIAALLKKMSSGCRAVAIAPDGPKGPRHEVKPGALYLASKTGAPLLPVAVASERHIRLNRSWDKMTIPLPFSRAVVYYGEIISVPADLDKDGMEKMRHDLENRMKALSEKAGAHFNRPGLES